MINLYIGKESLPKDKAFIFDTDKAILAVNLCGTDFQRKVLQEVEQGAYLNSSMFIDRFGGQLYYSEMSTGSKILFELEGLPDYVINCDECGENALRYISLIDNCNVYFSDRGVGLPWLRDAPIYFEGRLWERISLLNRRLD